MSKLIVEIFVTSCIKLVDVYGDGDSKLIVADADKRLKMYKGELELNHHPC